MIKLRKCLFLISRIQRKYDKQKGKSLNSLWVRINRRIVLVGVFTIVANT